MVRFFFTSVNLASNRVKFAKFYLEFTTSGIIPDCLVMLGE